MTTPSIEQALSELEKRYKEYECDIPSGLAYAIEDFLEAFNKNAIAVLQGRHRTLESKSEYSTVYKWTEFGEGTLYFSPSEKSE